MATILVEQRARSPWAGALVFPNPATGEILTTDLKLGTILDAACLKAGIPRMRIHDLRHGHASLWIMAGGSLTDVQRNLGHSTPVLTSETYGHIAEDHRVREADVRLALGIGKVMTQVSSLSDHDQRDVRGTDRPTSARGDRELA